ncbi:hypothetical protein MKK55_19860 [Methylobacterium sp. J-059]|uniref:head-tail connector protein n=1 Tax=Methylobacterium sp. J-059 TaxID=2836643 RepID=UPI001FBACC0D|nr:hypothetical protein [Methylobacterium sp. J-059]MCJ2041188.1 hypothetical protein [Methylobacterium sp. J-059]
MMPIRVAGAVVEPVSVPELRGYLRLDPDDATEDDLLAGLIAAARSEVEAETRRILVPGTWRMVLDRLPADGRVPVPLSPLVALVRAGFSAADGGIAEFAAGSASLAADRIEAPALLFAAIPDAAGRAVLVDLVAGYGGDGPPIPPPLRLAVLRRAAARYEHRGDDAFSDGADLASATTPFRRLRL